MIYLGYEFSQFEITQNKTKVLLIVVEKEMPATVIDELEEEYASGRFSGLTIGFESFVIGYQTEFPDFFSNRKKFLG